MSEEWSGTLAAEAAAWVPPWARRPAGTPADGQADQPAEQPPAGPPAQSPAQSPAAEPADPPADPPVPAAPPAERVPAARVAPVATVEPAGAQTPPGMTAEELRPALEAIMLVVDEPVSEIMLAQVLEQPTARIAAMLGELAAEYTDAGRGFDLRRVAGGWRLYTRPEYAGYVERFVLDGQHVKLTQAALETLAVVAYQQPVTRSRISAIRGVNCDGVVRTLVARGLVEVTGTEPDTGAFLYRTTTLFLEKLGVDGVDQLPPLAPFLPDDVEEIADAQH
jgi:segregation and condensation protein B